MYQHQYPQKRETRLSQHRTAQRPNSLLISLVALVIVVLAVSFVIMRMGHHSSALHMSSLPHTTVAVTAPHTKQPAQKLSICASNTTPQTVYVSISQRHMWACDNTSQQYDSAVITGMENIPADLTPIGTYHIYGKQANLYLNGSDSTGSWHDYVYYWMPFLSNQYGVYGFHDATWRKSDAFGNISPYSSDASHGCVELPLETAKWVYNWAAVGTTVIVQS